MRIIVIGSPDLSIALARHLHLPAVRELAEIATDGFILDGTALSLADARALDLILRARAAELEAVLRVAGGDPGLLGHYVGRIIELEPGEEAFESALDGLREILLVA